MELKLDSSYSPASIYTILHKLMLQTKLAHYNTKAYPAHEALGKTYATVEAMIDTIVEQLIGYSGVDPKVLTIGTVETLGVKELADSIMKEAHKMMVYAEKHTYCNIENLAQELSGAGAQLKYLSRFGGA